MGYISRREDRPKPWLARHKGPDGRHHSKAFRRKVDAEKWLALEESKSIRGEWVDTEAGESRQQGAGALTLLLAYAGLRWGEVVALRWENVDTARRRIHVKESATEIAGRLEWGAPKTHEVRTVIVPDFVVDALSEPSEGLVFTAPRGGPLRHSNFTKGVWAPACEAANMPDGLLIHDLRDTAASLAISAGASIKAVQRMLGHASAAMTLDTYGSLFDDDLEDLADRMQERYGAGQRGNVVRLSR
jgi:integrase